MSSELSESEVLNKFEERLERARRKLKEKLGLDEDDVETDDCESEDEEVEIDNEEFFSVEEVRDKRVVKNQEQYEVKWKGFEETSWEPIESFITKSSRLAIVQFYEKMWKKKLADGLKDKKVIKMNAEISLSPRFTKETSKKSDCLSAMDSKPQILRESNKKFASSLGEKRHISSNVDEIKNVKKVKTSNDAKERRPTLNERILRDKKASEEAAAKRKEGEKVKKEEEKPKDIKSASKSSEFSRSSTDSVQPEKKTVQGEKEWEKKLRIFQEKLRETRERNQREKELVEARLKELERREAVKQLLEDLGSSDDEEVEIDYGDNE